MNEERPNKGQELLDAVDDDTSAVVDRRTTQRRIPPEISDQKSELGRIFFNLGWFVGEPCVAMYFGDYVRWQIASDVITVFLYPDHFDIAIKAANEADMLAVLKAINQSGKFRLMEDDKAEVRDEYGTHYRYRTLTKEERKADGKERTFRSYVRRKLWEMGIPLDSLRRDK